MRPLESIHTCDKLRKNSSDNVNVRHHGTGSQFDISLSLYISTYAQGSQIFFVQSPTYVCIWKTKTRFKKMSFCFRHK